MPDSDRLIFKFFDGTRERAVDPLVTLRKLRTYPDVDKWLELAEQAPDERIRDESFREAVEAARDVFEVKMFSDDDGQLSGLTENETIALLDRFAIFLDDLKKNTNPKPTSPPSSEPAPCQESVESTNTSVLSASG